MRSLFATVALVVVFQAAALAGNMPCEVGVPPAPGQASPVGSAATGDSVYLTLVDAVARALAVF